ncbi:hypothetical protein SKAU_G00134180 [Synaphobranchus kaupii]|uniref:Uncharacterized protein n=1 Tax=Synaphobranchus kaupii TaxID=118154 RepID=A0A9Q1FS12_SYNKA|nr:hypothetical protein SKAU_G00134180 [Synaphobranchus kaupii]
METSIQMDPIGILGIIVEAFSQLNLLVVKLHRRVKLLHMSGATRILCNWFFTQPKQKTPVQFQYATFISVLISCQFCWRVDSFHYFWKFIKDVYESRKRKFPNINMFSGAEGNS